MCHVEWEAEVHGKPLDFGPYRKEAEESKMFKESVVTQAALGSGTTESEMCRQLASDNDGKFCTTCLKTEQIPGSPPFNYYDDTVGSDCFKCKEQCLIVVAPVTVPDIGVLTPVEICGNTQ